MKKKVMKGLPKRIAAFVMAVLMFFSLMPIDPSVVLAAEGTYTFSVKDSEGNAITNAIFTFYNSEGKEVDLEDVEISYNESEGIYSLTIDSEILQIASFTVSKDGYIISEEVNIETENNVTLIAETPNPVTSVEISGQITFAVHEESVSYEGLTVTLCNGNKEPIVIEENEVTASIKNEGTYTFTNVEVGQKYYVEVAHEKNTYAKQYVEVDLTSASENAENVNFSLVKNIEVALSIEPIEEDIVVGVVYVGGTVKPFIPTITGIEDGKTYTISYSSSNTEYATVDTEGKVTAEKTDNTSEKTIVTITATLEGESYVTTSVAYNVEVKERPEREPAYFYFNLDEIVLDDDSHFDYVENGTIDASATKPEDATQDVIYTIENPNDKIVAEIDSETGMLTIMSVGTATVTATLPAEGDYAETKISFELVIEPAEMEEFQIDLAGGFISTELEFEYENGATKDFTATINSSATIEGVEFSYDVSEDTIASFGVDENEGILTIHKAGEVTVTITATKDNYKPTTFEYIVKINKIDPELDFDRLDENFKDSFINGEFLFDNFNFYEPGLKAADGVDLSSVTYEVTYSNDEVSDLVIVASDGKVTFNELKQVAGELVVTITAKLPETENYAADTATYEFTIIDGTLSNVSELVEVIGTELVDGSGWYTTVDEEHPITIRLKEGTNYKIYATAPGKVDLENEVTSFNIISMDEGDNNSVSFYIYNSEDGCVSLCSINGIKVDTVGLSAYAVALDNTILAKVWNFFSFLNIETIPPTITVTWSESFRGSAVSVYYYVEKSLEVLTEEQLNALDSSKWSELTEETKLPTDEGKSVVYAKVVDEAGHVAYANSKGMITDNQAPSVTLASSEIPEDQNGYYKNDFSVTVNVVEQTGLSGIKEIRYWIGEKTGEGEELYKLDVTDETPAGNFKYTLSPVISNIVAADYNNVDGVTVFVEATDNAGNKFEVQETYKVCIETPEIDVDYGENDPVEKATIDGIHYYDAVRNATITINSRADVFNKANAVVKVDGVPVLNEWDGQSVEVSFVSNGKHTLEVSYVNEIGDVAESYSEIFWIDTDEPTGSATLHNEDAEDSIWAELLETLTFGIWKKATATVTAIANTDTTAVAMQYYVSNTDTILTKDDLNALTADKWTNYTSGVEIAIASENVYAVYFKLVDVVGHVTYLSTDGFIVDMEGSVVALTPTVAPNTNGYYNNDVELNLTVTENISGIKSVEYWIVRDTIETEHETLYTFSNESPIFDDLEQTYTKRITVDALENNSKNVIVYAKVIDNAGYETVAEHALKINSTAPSVEISYDNNNATGHDGGVNYFFNALRTATITITDRADTFDATAATNAIKVVLKDKDGNTVVDNGVVISEWTSVGDKHSATIAFVKDGYYTVSVEYTNKADLSNTDNEGNYVVTPTQDTVAGLAFVIDTTNPVDVTVSALTKVWNELLEAITFGLYTAEDVVFTITGDDVTSNVTIEYYIANDGTAKTVEQLAQVVDSFWTEYKAPVTISEEQQMSVFVRVTDQAGNRVYVNSNGIVLDKTKAGITLTAEAANVNGVYNSDVDIEIDVDDSAITSGIKLVEYWITKDGVETKHETLYTNTNLAPTKAELKQTYNGTITVDAMTNNSSNVEVFVKVVDNAGNVNQDSVELDIDMVAPTIEVSYDNNEYTDILDGIGYFDESRTATIVVTERTNHFDKDAFANSVAITAKNFAGANIDTAVPVVDFISTTEGATADAATHIFKVVFSADANYTLAISYADKAGWICSDDKVEYDEESVTPQNFVIDITAPTGKITVGNLGFWETLLQSFTFGLWSPSDVNIVITAIDATSPVKSIEYYKTSTFTPMTETELKTVTDWVPGDKFTVSNDDIFVVYAKITDQTGNVKYISSNGIIVDETKPVFETYSPEITITPERPVNGIYDGNVKVDVGVIDPVVGGNSAYAGLRSIVYEVYNMGTKTQEGTLFNFAESNPSKDKLIQKWNGQDIVVDASKNNSNDVVVKVIATDNAGNQSVATTTLKIDITKPVIEVSYDNNNGDATFVDGVYYNSNRIATIKVTERNFDASLVNAVITNTDGMVPTISGWTTTAGTGNGDNTVHTATIVYAADGDYTFAISAKDKVGNTNEAVNYSNSQAPTAFTIDKTVPVISIAYDNNDFANENYYKADRTATISILEHNFDASRVVVTITATDNGQPVNAPVISNWSKSGDTYTATVNYSVDALYTFDISYSDKAQNEAADFAQQSFYVDKTMPQMSITEIVDQSANNKDKIGFVITATDTNFDVFAPVLTAVVKTETGFTTKELNIASITDIANGRVYTISNIDADGIYRITCTLVDKAGNAYNAVTLQQADGTPYIAERTAEDTLVTFSVNRDGSTFEVDEATKEVLDNYYVYDVKEDVVIVEVNANQLTSNTVSLNGKELVEGTDFTIATEGGNGAWLRYVYTLNKELFAEEGEYTIVVSSVDEAENNAFSDVKNTKVAFVVDRTAPVVTVSGLETNGRYQTDAQTVTLIPTDDGGAVKSIVVNQVDAEGNVIKKLQEELSGDALETALEANDGQISFVISSGTYDYIEIVCADCSVNETGSTNTVEILIEDVLITENELALIWATYQYAIIGGGVAAVAIPIGIVLFRRRIKVK